MDELERELRAQVSKMRAARRRALGGAIGAALFVGLMVPIWTAYGDDAGRLVRGEMTLSGEPAYHGAHPADPTTLASIDFQRVHEREIPRWTIALAHANTPYWERRADSIFKELAAEVGPDQNLVDLLTRTHGALRSDEPLEHAERLDYWLWAYNAYLDEQHIPWRLEATLRFGEERTVLWTRTYEILADGRNEDGQRLRLLRRADRTNSLEGWLGRTGRGDEGAMIVMERVLHFTVRHVWPGLHPALDHRRPERERSWLSPVRTEVAAIVSPTSMAILNETAEDQQALIEVAAAVERRRHLCNGRLHFRDLPYNGLSQRSLEAILAAVERSRINFACPEITLDEAARITGASERLGQTDGLTRAIEELAMAVARSVGAHELRHVADGEDLECPGCPDALRGITRDEVSAYLAAFADRDVGYLALLQACGAARGNETPQSAARTAVLDAVLPLGCDGPPHPAMRESARDIEERLFGERTRAVVPELPPRVALLPDPQRTRAASLGFRPLPGGWGADLRPR